MLKRNGQYAKHNVGNYPQRLTDDEYEAYQNVTESLRGELGDLTAISDAVRRIEEDGIAQKPANGAPEEIVMDSGERWQIQRPLVKLSQTEICLCQKGAEFAIVERFSETSAYAKANRPAEITLTGNNERQVLQDFVQNENQTLRLFANDLLARAGEELSEKYPRLDCRRVAEAIEHKCNAEITHAPTKTQAIVQETVQMQGIKA